LHDNGQTSVPTSDCSRTRAGKPVRSHGVADVKFLQAKIALAVLSTAGSIGVVFIAHAIVIHLDDAEFETREEAMRRDFAKPIIATEGPRWCQIHEVVLKKDLVPIHYGLPGIPCGYLEARSNRFPHANDHDPGGCSLTTFSPRSAVVLYCLACRREKTSWHTEMRSEQYAREAMETNHASQG